MRFDRRYSGGEIGAERWLDDDGNPFVLKRGRSAARAVAVTARLRELGYPAPRYVRVEADWALQEELPGEPLEPWQPLPEEIVAQLLSLQELHAEAFPASQGSWRRVVVSSVLSGARSYLRLATLATTPSAPASCSPAARTSCAAAASRCRSWTRSCTGTSRPTTSSSATAASPA